MALASNYVVEVRSVNFGLVGQIAPEYLDLMYTERFNTVGKWELKLPAEHPMLATLKAKGSGIKITEVASGKVFSGRMQSCALSQDASDPKGTWVIDGVDDNIIAAASLCFPSPALAPDAQATDYWTYTGPGESVLKNLVAANVGATATAARKYSWLAIPADLGQGATISASLRFDNMGDALTALATRAGLGWRFYQSGSGVVFDTYVPSDKSATVRLDIRNGGLESTQLGYSAPTATQVLVLGQGQGEDRTVMPVTTTASLAEATAWGLRWEINKDERNTDDTTELTQAGQEILTDQGSTINSLKVTPSDAPNQRLGVDWFLGDIVTVIVDDSPATATVTEVATSITSEGIIRQATVGDPVGFDWEAKVGQAISDQDTRISALEATVDAAIPLVPGSVFKTGDLKMTAASTPGQAGWLLCDGTAYSRTDYADLFASIGTTFGVGDGSTTFNVPNFQGQVPAGASATDTDFQLGKTVGAKTNSHNHTLSDSGYAQVSLGAVSNNAVKMRRVNTPTWTSAVQTTNATGGSGGGDQTTGAALGGNTDSATPSVVQPTLGVNFLIKT